MVSLNCTAWHLLARSEEGNNKKKEFQGIVKKSLPWHGAFQRLRNAFPSLKKIVIHQQKKKTE